MTQEDKEILIRDLCGRLPCGMKAYIKKWSKLDRKYYEGVYTVESIDTSLNTIIADSERSCVEVIVGYYDSEIKPYLFPLSSMTDAEKEEYYHLQQRVIYNSKGLVNEDVTKYINWCYKKHLDINNLIPMGLAIDATGLNIY